ncbi:MAG: COQ9 family protein, partial [Pseudomonadota bacterium]
ALLSAVIPRIVLYWLEQPNSERVERFITLRLQEAMKLGQAGGKVLGPVLDFAERLKARREARDL